MQILVTGASGFIGSFLVEYGIEKEHNVWAGMRATSSRRYLSDKRIGFVELNLNDEETLCRQLQQHRAETGKKWDIVIHAAGATKCSDKGEFFRTNTEGTIHLVEALRRCDMLPKQFVYLSSLSIFGPIREERVAPYPCRPWAPRKGLAGAPLDTLTHKAIGESDTPRPNTAYGESKLAAERYLQAQTDLPCVIFRPTGVYGPRERDYFLMAQSIARRIDFAAGLEPQEITFIYVKDLVRAVYLAIEKGITGRSYFVSDGQVYRSRAFSDLLQEAMGIRNVLHVTAPLPLLRGICAIGERVSRWTGKPVTLNADKYHIMKQRNWICDIAPLEKELGYKPSYDLARGVAEAVAWYKKEKWL